jgi:hypothetical protein
MPRKATASVLSDAPAHNTRSHSAALTAISETTVNVALVNVTPVNATLANAATLMLLSPLLPLSSGRQHA